MNKPQLQEFKECYAKQCHYFGRCEVHWGQKCTRQGGTKIPRIRIVPKHIEMDEYNDIVTIKKNKAV